MKSPKAPHSPHKLSGESAFMLDAKAGSALSPILPCTRTLRHTGRVAGFDFSRISGGAFVARLHSCVEETSGAWVG